MTKFALYVPLQAKPGKEKEVADFLRSALPLVNAEAGTISWFAIQEGPSSFAIFDTFDDEAGRDAHLNGKVAAALMAKAKAGDLFAKTPEIYKLEILADKLPKSQAPRVRLGEKHGGGRQPGARTQPLTRQAPALSAGYCADALRQERRHPRRAYDARRHGGLSQV